ncbi:MAG: dTMP kinase [Chthoniobacter sp.]|jgi:dTMP kinase|nr:dTMP kinase [Chthoniobacter sp.]
MAQRGFFITFEGSEGCGKTTQIQRLASRLERENHKVLVTREPGGTDIGEEIKHLLQFSRVGATMTAETELLLFAASRAQLVRERVEPALREGAIVLSDRFLDSTTVYQGVARRLDAAAVKMMNDFAVGGCRPDLTFVLDLDPRLARERMLCRTRSGKGPADRMEQQPLDFYDAVRDGYLALAAAESARVRVIEASHPIEAIEDEVWRTVGERLSSSL